MKLPRCLSRSPASGDDPAELRELIEDASQRVARTLDVYQASRRINNVRTAGPSDSTLIEPVER